MALVYKNMGRSRKEQFVTVIKNFNGRKTNNTGYNYILEKKKKKIENPTSIIGQSLNGNS